MISGHFNATVAPDKNKEHQLFCICHQLENQLINNISQPKQDHQDITTKFKLIRFYWIPSGKPLHT